MNKKKEINLDKFLKKLVPKKKITWESLIGSMVRSKIQKEMDFQECCNDCRVALWRGLKRFDKSKSNGKSLRNYLLMQFDSAINGYCKKYYAKKYKSETLTDPNSIEYAENAFETSTKDGTHRAVNYSSTDSDDYEYQQNLASALMEGREGVGRFFYDQMAARTYDGLSGTDKIKYNNKNYDSIEEAEKDRRKPHILDNILFRWKHDEDDRTEAKEKLEDLKGHLDMQETFILDSMLEGFTQKEIATKLGYKSHSKVSDKLKDIRKKAEELWYEDEDNI